MVRTLKTGFKMKRLFHISWASLLLIVVSVFIWLRPMSVNVLNYLIWKYSMAAPAETGNIVYQGAHIHYVSYGHGEPVLLLHGGLSNKLSWFFQIPWLVASGRRVVLIDTRGHGDSTPGHSKLSYRIFADTLLVLDRLGIQRTDIVGERRRHYCALAGPRSAAMAAALFGRIGGFIAVFYPDGYYPADFRRLAGDF